MKRVVWLPLAAGTLALTVAILHGPGRPTPGRTAERAIRPGGTRAENAESARDERPAVLPAQPPVVDRSDARTRPAPDEAARLRQLIRTILERNDLALDERRQLESMLAMIP